jgi:hypothetical protein
MRWKAENLKLFSGQAQAEAPAVPAAAEPAAK